MVLGLVTAGILLWLAVAVVFALAVGGAFAKQPQYGTGLGLLDQPAGETAELSSVHAFSSRHRPSA